MGPGMSVHQSRHHGPLGTVVEIHIESESDSAALHAEQTVVAEIDRLEDILSVYRTSSDLNLWVKGEIEPGDELVAVLSESLKWQQKTAGAYNPEVGRISDLWERCAEKGVVPSPRELERLARHIASPGFALVGDRIEVGRDLKSINLNALAKGWIVDRATHAARNLDGVEGVMVNAGGDLLNLGSSVVRVGIEDPLRRYDNVPSSVVVGVDPGTALATSGGSRRGWSIGDAWYSHVIDPRTGWPTSDVASVTALAPCAATADVLATALTVLGPSAGIELVESIPDVDCLVISPDGERHISSSWHERVVR